MSRTDHHRPWRIRAEDRTVNDGLAYFWHNDWVHAKTGECDSGCGWKIPYWAVDQPDRAFVHDVWYGPERVRERTRLRDLAREYNAHGDLDDGDFPNWQHRHSAHWLWW